MGRARTLSRIIISCSMLIGAAIALNGCGESATSDAVAADAPKQHGGSITVGVDQEPKCLNTKLSCGSMASTSRIMDTIFDSMLTVDENGQYAPLIATRVPSTDNGDVVELPGGGMTVKMGIRPEAHWSDGTPITCDDVRFVWETTMNNKWMILGRNGWDLIKKIDCPNKHTAIYHFTARYAPFLGIVGAAPLPAHILRGKNFNTFMNDNIPVSSGPFKFGHWKRSVEIVTVRDENYWNAGEEKIPYLDSMKYKFVADTNTLKIQLRTGEVDLIDPPPDSTLKAELENMPRSDFSIEPDVFWEQLAFNTAKEPTNDLNVRKAIALSIDRSQITDVVLKKQVGVLNSTILPAQTLFHVPAWAEKEGIDKEAEAKQLLEKAGYTKSGMYYTKNGKPLKVVFKSVAGNDLRLKVAQLLQQTLKRNGIQMEIVMEPGQVFFGQSTVQGSFNLALWAWSSGIDPSQRNLFSCDKIPTEANDYEGQNYYRYCNERVTELLKSADVEPDVAKRQAMIKEVQTLMAADMPVLPIFQRPATVAYSKKVQSIKNNPLAGLTWNTYDWAVAK